MILRLSVLALAASLLTSQTLVLALSPADIPPDTPLNSLISQANALLGRGEVNDALTYYDVAISRDPNSYLTYFKRATAYLSLGRTAQAIQDFDKVLQIKPGFEGALLQRAKIRARNGEWGAAKADYAAAGKGPDSPEMGEVLEAQGAATMAADAEKAAKWEECVTHAGAAIMLANKVPYLRQIRAHCRFERGEMEEGISDLAHVLQLRPGETKPHIQISSILFYALRDTEKGLAQIRKCLHSDPDSKSCKQMHRRMKQIERDLKKVNAHFEKKQYASGVKILVPQAEEPGLIQEVKDDVKSLREDGTIPAAAPNNLVARVVEMACEAYYETNNHKKAQPYCDEALALYEFSLHGLLEKARRQMEAEDYERAVNTLNTAKEHHPSASQINNLLQKAQVALKRSKTKDYYKVLGIPNDADELQIKSAYRKATKVHHPDKAIRNGVTKEDAEKKMASINEAYEVLSDPELRARFDRGDDPNSHEGQGGGNPFQGSPFGGGGQQFMFHQGGHRQSGGGFQFQFPGGFPGGNPFGM